MDLLVEDDSAGLSAYADVVVHAVGKRDNLVVVGQSFAGYVAPIVCARAPARLLVLVGPMIPALGESAEAMFANTRYVERRASAKNADDRYVFSNHRHTCVADRAKKAAAILCKGGVSFQFRAHDLRRTAASYMGKAGVDRFHIAHVVNHRSVTHSTVTAIYDRYRYDKEKRATLEKWAEVLTEIVDIKPAPTAAPARPVARANVYEFKPQVSRRAQASVH
jgi:hypothetical protein